MDNAHQAKLEAARQRFMRLPGEWQTGTALGIFIGARGRLWRDYKGYHARLYAPEPICLLPFQMLWGGRIHSLARGKVVCRIDKKEHVLDLFEKLNKLYPGRYTLPEPKPAGRPKKCKHCGNSVNNHDPECYDAVSES